MSAPLQPKSSNIQALKPVAKPLGQILLANGGGSHNGLSLALNQQKTTKGPLGEILIAHSLSPEISVIKALAAQSGKAVADNSNSAKPFESDDPIYWITQAMMPWGKDGGHWQVATSDQSRFEKQRRAIENKLGPASMVWASHAQIQARQQKLFGAQLARHAEACVPTEKSCRGLRFTSSHKALRWAVMAGLAAAVILLILLKAAHPLFILCLLLVMCNLIVSTLLKAMALLFALQSPQPSKKPFEGLPDVVPKVSILIPLYREKNIAAQLVANLEKLNYPRSHLEVILVLESHDTQTRACLEAIELPKWMRVIHAAPGTIKTKPRALNYALPFCSGEIIGVLDAEDAPEPDQLRAVVTRFSSVSAKTVCLQGRLDYYNPQSNWLARCFTMEYASWFRIMLQALAQIGFAIPLGGTTLYFRRSALVELGGWDAHNVTEDADLGIRLARAGYRCAMLKTTTFEEANNMPLSWVQQRSRWIKGYFMTYAVHMRSPKTLRHDLGLWQFCGFQAVFLPSLLMPLLAPVSWSFWLIALGLVPQESFGVPAPVLIGLICLYAMAFTLDLLISAVGVFKAGHLRLLPWIPSQYFYYPLATLAAFKALFEVIIAPFYWDKTSHGNTLKRGPKQPRTLV